MGSFSSMAVWQREGNEGVEAKREWDMGAYFWWWVRLWQESYVTGLRGWPDKSRGARAGWAEACGRARLGLRRVTAAAMRREAELRSWLDGLIGRVEKQVQLGQRIWNGVIKRVHEQVERAERDCAKRRRQAGAKPWGYQHFDRVLAVRRRRGCRLDVLLRLKGGREDKWVAFEHLRES